MYMHRLQNVVYMSLSVYVCVCVYVCVSACVCCVCRVRVCVYIYRYINIIYKCMYISIFVLFPTIVHA